MTFLSVTPDAFLAEVSAVPRRRAVARPAPLAAHLMATVIVAAALFVPAAEAQAKLKRLGIVFTIVQQRCMASLSA